MRSVLHSKNKVSLVHYSMLQSTQYMINISDRQEEMSDNTIHLIFEILTLTFLFLR